MLINLVGINNILPHYICRWSNTRQGVEKRLRKPYRKHRILLPKSLSARCSVAITLSKPLAKRKLHYASHKSNQSQEKFGIYLGHAILDDEVGGFANNNNQRQEPYIEG